MADITCEVIRDLMPLYVDDVLSSDSKAFVEEHLETCEGCTDYYHALKEPEGNYKQMKNDYCVEASTQMILHYLGDDNLGWKEYIYLTKEDRFYGMNPQ